MQLNQSQAAWARDILDRTQAKMERVCARSAGKIPYTTVDGVHDDRSGDGIGWWTNGFWGGIQWQLFALTGDERYRRTAQWVEDELDQCFLHFDMLDHDNGFKWLPTAVANYRATGNQRSKNRGLLAAEILAGRYNCAGRFLRAWNDWAGSGVDRSGWAIIDCMMNLPLLYWASEVTGDPRFAQIAGRHADTSARYFVRRDGSVHHIVQFDTATGDFIAAHGGQGIGVGSSWTRGQAWGLYGFALSYLHTQSPAYLSTSERIANYFIANIPDSGLIPVDFRQPADVAWQDSSAAAIAACGLIELAKLHEGRQREVYLGAAMKLLRALAGNCVNWNEDQDNLLTKCTAAYHDQNHEFSIIYGDYFFLEALMKLTGEELFIW